MNDAFVYCWTDHKTRMLYVGSRKGTPTDGYICSSKIMLQEYGNRPKDFSREILAIGEFSDMRKFEEIILKSVNARYNDDFYNQHNSDGKFTLLNHTENSKKLIGNAIRGNKRPDLIKRNKLGHSSETKSKISENHIDVSGEYNPMYGKKHNNESIEKMKLARKGKGNNPKSEETKRKMSEARRSYWEKKKELENV